MRINLQQTFDQNKWIKFTAPGLNNKLILTLLVNNVFFQQYCIQIGLEMVCFPAGIKWFLNGVN